MSDSIIKNFINGEFVEPQSHSSTIDLINPADETLLGRVPLCNEEIVNSAVIAAENAFNSWNSLTIKQRASIMFKFHSLIENHSHELAQLIVLENGKNITEALADVAKGNETVEWATSLPQLATGKILEVSKGITCQEIRSPLGVVAAIVPFNFPFMVPMWTIPISLTLGNCVILKPSEKVPLTMTRVAELLTQAGVPPGVFQIVQGGVDVVNALSGHNKIAAVTFVGSSNVAKIVSDKCHAVNKRVLALGGAKNHLIALPDCDIGMTTRDIVASFAGCCGQRCMAASVLIVVGKNDVLLDKLVETAGQLVAGQEAGQVGPLIDNIAKERVLSYIDNAESSGSKILLDGRSWTKKSPGYWFGPTIILHTSSTDKAMTDEIFGPVLSIIQVDTWDEALTIENSNPYGNAACIYTENGSNAEYFVKRFRTAMIGVNIGIPVPREPFSFGGLYGTKSKFGDFDITGDGAMEFFSNRIKVTTKWSSSYSTSNSNIASSNENANKKLKIEDKANFDGKM
eukprot:gene20265-26309_t